jgi:3'(2'), 5'-bisphosphate nucleotidase
MVTPAITKTDRSPVTVADFAAQAVVGYLLTQRLPGARLVGEEQSDLLRSPNEQQTLEKVTSYVNKITENLTSEEVCSLIDKGNDSPGNEFWTLDPIDGTKGFLRGGQYACALAYIKGGVVKFGVLGCPNITPDHKEEVGGVGALLIGIQGEGSWISTLRGEIKSEMFQPIKVSSRSQAETLRLMRSFESGHTNIEKIEAFQNEMGMKSDPVKMDSQVKYALLASGIGEVYLRLLSPNSPDYREMIWDQAAGSIIVEEAGGLVTDLDGKKLDFGQGQTLKKNRGICASNGQLHDQILEALRTVNA